MTFSVDIPPAPVAVAEPSPAALRWKSILAVVAIAACVHLAVATRYGWHRDEFYYLASGRHLALGYPDQPPGAPLLALLGSYLPGGLLPLRLIAIAAHLGCVVLAAVLAAQMGGRWRAQALAAAAVAVCPVFVGASALFGTTVLDELAWAAVLVLLVRALRTGRLVDWAAVGVVAGAGLETKDTLAVLLVGVLAGLAITRRSVLRHAGPWIAAGAALVLWLPNLGWDAANHWANLSMASVEAAKNGGPLGALTKLPMLLLVLAGPLLVWLWILGVRHLLGPSGRPHRWIVVAAAVELVAFTAAGGKDYYPAPILVALFAAGATAIEGRLAPGCRLARRWPLGIALSAVTTVLVTLPVLPPAAAGAMNKIDPVVVETYGWPYFADEIAAYARQIPQATVVFTSNYGEAGALQTFGAADGLRIPVVSGHNGYGYWGPPRAADDEVLAVGEWPASYLEGFWGRVVRLGPVAMPGGIRDEETTGSYGSAAPAAVYLCEDPKAPWAALWPALRHLD